MLLEVELAAEVAAAAVASVINVATRRGHDLRFRPPRSGLCVSRRDRQPHSAQPPAHQLAKGSGGFGNVSPRAEAIAGGDMLVVGRQRGLTPCRRRR